MAAEGAVFWIFLTGAVSGQVLVVHPLSMAAALCLKFILGRNTLLEWQTYTVDLNNSSLLILMKFLLLLISLCCHFFLYSLSLPSLVSFFVALLMCPVLGSGHFAYDLLGTCSLHHLIFLRKGEVCTYGLV